MAEFIEQASFGWMMTYVIAGIVLLVAFLGFQRWKPAWQIMLVWALVFPMHAAAAVGAGLLVGAWFLGKKAMQEHAGTMLALCIVIVWGARTYVECATRIRPHEADLGKKVAEVTLIAVSLCIDAPIHGFLVFMALLIFFGGLVWAK